MVESVVELGVVGGEVCERDADEVVGDAKKLEDMESEDALVMEDDGSTEATTGTTLWVSSCSGRRWLRSATGCM